MIAKPEITKNLAWTAFWLEISWIALNVIFIFTASIFPLSDAYSSIRDIKIPLSLPVIYAVGQCCMIPFAWSCLRSALQKELNNENGVVLPAILYFIGILLNWLIQNFGTAFISRFYTLDVYGAFSMRIHYRGIMEIFPVQIAALVLICCASAIEMYILKHKEFSV